MRLRMFLCLIVACCWGKTLSIPQHIINEMKSNLLPLFGFKERPRFGGLKPQIPETLKKLYDKQIGLEYDTASLPLPGLHAGSANTVRSFVHVESPIDATFVSSNKFRLKFDVSVIPKTEKIKAAQIQLTHQSYDSNSSQRRLLVHDIIRRGIKGVHPPITRLIDSQLIDSGKNATIIVDVFPAVERWLQNSKTNHGVLIELRASKSRMRLKRDVDDDWLQKQPFLFTYTDDGKNRQRTKEEMVKLRPKRGAKRHRKNEKDPCRRREMTVDFRDVGWSDWIVAPLGYDAFYCGGECDYPLPEHFNTTNHAIVQSIVNSVKPTEVPKPCCVPTHLSAMSMLYVGNDNNVILKNYHDMVVEGCGCR